jgi:hypothetical protein
LFTPSGITNRLHPKKSELANRQSLAIPGVALEVADMPLVPTLEIRINRIIGVVGLLVGLVLLLGGSFVIHQHHLDEFLFKRAVAEGQVVENRRREIHPRTGGNSDLPFTTYHAIVRFTDQRGQLVTYSDEFGFSNPSFHVGQTVTIFYDPQNSQHAMIDRGLKNFIVPGICFIFGGLMVLGSLQRLAKSSQIPPSASALQ